MADKISLSPEDPTIFAKCQKCSRSGKGEKVGDIFLKAFTARRWKRSPVCENCGSELIILYEVE